MPPSARVLVLDNRDNVAVSLGDISSNTSVRVKRGHELLEIMVQEVIPFGHKFAITNIAKGRSVYKYGEIIGKAVKPIRAGQHVHIQNVESIRGKASHQKRKLGRP